MVYRPLTVADLDQYKEIRLECLQNHPQNFGTLYEEEMLATSLKFDQIIAQNNGSDCLLGAFENEKLVGICGYMQEKRTKTKHIGEISQMYVRPSFSKKGIGKNLLQRIIQHAFSNTLIEFVTLGVVQSNQHALDLYAKADFVQYGILENYFKRNDAYETMLFMVLTRKVFEKMD